MENLNEVGLIPLEKTQQAEIEGGWYQFVAIGMTVAGAYYQFGKEVGKAISDAKALYFED